MRAWIVGVPSAPLLVDPGDRAQQGLVEHREDRRPVVVAALRMAVDVGAIAQGLGHGPGCYRDTSRRILLAARSSAPSSGRPSTSTSAALPTARNVSQANELEA